MGTPVNGKLLINMWKCLSGIFKNKYLKNVLKLIISLSFLVYFLCGSNIKAIIIYLKSASVWIFVAMIILNLISVFMNSLKWHLLLKKQKIGDLFRLNLIAQFYTLILPGQIAGEAVKTVILGKSKNDFEGIAVSVIVDKITGFLGLFIIMLVGLFLTNILYSKIMLWSILSAFAIGIFFLFCLQINFIFNIIDQFLNRIEIKYPKLKKIVFSLQKAFHAWHIYSKSVITLLISISGGIIYQFMGVLLFYIFANNMIISIPLIDWFWIVGLLSIALFLPITIGGIGVREGTLVGILGTLGIVQEKALALSFVIFGVQIITSLIGGIVVLGKAFQPVQNIPQ